jgi:hypothetical protein
MTDQYQTPDREVVDYQIYQLDEKVLDRQTETPLGLRGPRPSNFKAGHYFVCIGAAQTFGRFCRTPYPELLGQMLRLPALNLGRGGAGFSFFLKDNENLLRYINRSRFAVIQVMAARSESNALYKSKGLGYYYRVSDGAGIGCDAAFGELLAQKNPVLLEEIISQNRENWYNNCRELLALITVPTILFWFSTRKPDYRENLGSDLEALFGEFPQLVNAQMMHRIRGEADAYVECISRKGLPQTLRSRFTGRRITITDPWGGIWEKNWYYPSPSMHKKAARALYRVCRDHVPSATTGSVIGFENLIRGFLRRKA